MKSEGRRLWQDGTGVENFGGDVGRAVGVDVEMIRLNGRTQMIGEGCADESQPSERLLVILGGTAIGLQLRFGKGRGLCSGFGRDAFDIIRLRTVRGGGSKVARLFRGLPSGRCRHRVRV